MASSPYSAVLFSRLCRFSASSRVAATVRSFCSSSPSPPFPGYESGADFPQPEMEERSSAATDDTNGSTYSSRTRRVPLNRPLENGLDPGVYKAIMLGKVGQPAVQKRLKNGMAVVLFSLGTGGIRNNRRPMDNEDPQEYADRCAVQWHRVCVYPARLGDLALKHLKTGSILYLEGNLEAKVFSDPITGLVRRLREIAVRRDGRLVFLGDDASVGGLGEQELKGVGYF